jgi:hypothetical protein
MVLARIDVQHDQRLRAQPFASGLTRVGKVIFAAFWVGTERSSPSVAAS